jgi:integrase
MSQFPKPWLRRGRGWYVTLDGTQIFLGKKKAEAFAEYQELLRKPRENRQVIAESVVALIDRFLEWTQKHRAADTYEWYRYRLQLFARRYPDLLARDLRPFHVQDWIDSYDLASGTKRNYARAIMRCLAWAEEQGRIDRNPIRHFKKPKGGRRNVVISPAEYDRILAAIRNPSFRDLVTFAWETGARAAECLAIEKRHVDLPNHRIVFPVDEEKMQRAPRVIYLSDAAEEIIRRLALRSPEGRLFRNDKDVPWTTEAVNCAFIAVQVRLGNERLKADGFVLTEAEIAERVQSLPQNRTLPNGTMIAKSKRELREDAQSRLRRAAAVKLGPKYCLTHFRHSWCHRMLTGGTDALTVSVLMGHADPSMIARVYSHLTQAPEYLLKAVRRTAS